ncbi:MAG: type II toxin-antitoxin system VapC family toxin [Actinomycetota bacterium]|nr:type II toxin-antitoxin system VapC family toxin [Actinomycetota bacterium]
MIYLDTSALLKLYVKEEGYELVRQAVGVASTVATSTVAYAEARAGLARRFREGDFTEEEHRGAVKDLNGDWPVYDRLSVSDSVAYQAGELAERYALRGYDAVHLASAVRLSERFGNLRFLAFDGRLNDATKAADLAVYDDESRTGRSADG